MDRRETGSWPTGCAVGGSHAVSRMREGCVVVERTPDAKERNRPDEAPRDAELDHGSFPLALRGAENDNDGQGIFRCVRADYATIVNCATTIS